MNIRDFKAGLYKKGYDYEYFLPNKVNHPFTWENSDIGELLEMASFKLGELSSFSRFAPDTGMFTKMLVYKEAVRSSKIEGTKTNMEDALTDEKEISPEKRDDWQEVNNYVLAMNDTLEELDSQPLSNRLIRNAHKKLLSSGRGQSKCPGEFRKSQNWIGGASLKDATFIPPAHTELADLLSDLEMFLNNKTDRLPHLIKIAIAHYQFETIHPFLDGNGRVGRLLITLYLVSANILNKPLLYLSDFFERNRRLYYQNLELVRTDDNLEQWIKFFLTGVIETAEKSVDTLETIIGLKKHLEANLLKIGNRSTNALKLLEHLFSQPVIRVADVEKTIPLSPKAANNLIKLFVEMNILKEVSNLKRYRIFVFEEYLQLFGE